MSSLGLNLYLCCTAEPVALSGVTRLSRSNGDSEVKDLKQIKFNNWKWLVAVITRLAYVEKYRFLLNYDSLIPCFVKEASLMVIGEISG